MVFKRLGFSEALPFSWALGWKLQENTPKCWQYPRNSSAAEVFLLQVFLLGSVVQGFLLLGGRAAVHGVRRRLLHPLLLLYQELVQHQEMSFPKLSPRATPLVEQWASLLTSQETPGPHCSPGCPLAGLPMPVSPLFLMSLYLVPFSRWHVRSTTETLGVATQKAMSLNILFCSWGPLLTVLAAPVNLGLIIWVVPQPLHPSFPEGLSAIFWVVMIAWIVVMSSSTMPELSWMTSTNGG